LRSRVRAARSGAGAAPRRLRRCGGATKRGATARVRGLFDARGARGLDGSGGGAPPCARRCSQGEPRAPPPRHPPACGRAWGCGGGRRTLAALESRLDRDLDRGVTGVGPHLDDILIASGTRDLRSFGSQGEQRLAVLALLLAEAELLADRRGSPPLLLLDDVLS